MGRVGLRFEKFERGKETFVQILVVLMCDNNLSGIIEVMFKICFKGCTIEISNEFFLPNRRPKFGRGGGKRRLGQCPNFRTFFFLGRP